MSYKHGHCVNGKITPEYRAWYHMLERCQNPNCKIYHHYGSRGITVCKHWLKFENFLEDMGLRPQGLTLDRIDNDGNYEKSNCRWTSWHKQGNNRRPISCGPQKQRQFIAFGPNGEQIISNNQHEFAKKYKLNQGNISSCLCKVSQRKSVEGWTFRRLELGT